MSELWGAALVSVAGGLISGAGANRASGKETRATKEMTRDQALYETLISQFEREQEYFYQQQDKLEKMRGLDQFKQFSTLSQFAPEYTPGAPAVQMPARPVIPNFNVNHKNFNYQTPTQPATPVITAPVAPA